MNKDSNRQAILLEHSFEWASVAKTALHKEGIEVICWNQSGVGWFDTYKDNKPNIFIIDYLLSKRDAFECIRKLRELQSKPYIVFTHAFYGTQATYYETRALRLGADSVVQKPYTPQRMNASLKRYLASITNSNK